MCIFFPFFSTPALISSVKSELKTAAKSLLSRKQLHSRAHVDSLIRRSLDRWKDVKNLILFSPTAATITTTSSCSRDWNYEVVGHLILAIDIGYKSIIRDKLRSVAIYHNSHE